MSSSSPSNNWRLLWYGFPCPFLDQWLWLRWNGKAGINPNQPYSWGYGEVALQKKCGNGQDSATLPGPAFGCLTATHSFHTLQARYFSTGTSCETSLLKARSKFNISCQCANLVKWFFFVQWSVGKWEVKPHPEKFQIAKDIQWLPALTHTTIFLDKSGEDSLFCSEVVVWGCLSFTF